MQPAGPGGFIWCDCRRQGEFKNRSVAAEVGGPFCCQREHTTGDWVQPPSVAVRAIRLSSKHRQERGTTSDAGIRRRPIEPNFVRVHHGSMKKKQRFVRTLTMPPFADPPEESVSASGQLDCCNQTTTKTSGRLAELTNEVWLLTMALVLAAPGLRAWGGQSVSLAWDASPTIDVMGYVVHYGGASRKYTTSLDVGDTTTATVRGLNEGVNYFFAVTAYDPVGRNSVPSNEISYQVPIAVPGTTPHVELTVGDQAGVAAQIRFAAFPNENYELQATEDFRSWTPIWNATPVSTIQRLEFQDSGTTALGSRFYRIVVH